MHIETSASCCCVFFSLVRMKLACVFVGSGCLVSVVCSAILCVHHCYASERAQVKEKEQEFRGYTKNNLHSVIFWICVFSPLSLSFYLPLLLLPSVTCVTASSESSFLDICYLCSVCSCCVCSYAIAPRVYRFSFFGLRFRFTWFLDTFRYARNVQSLLTQKQNKIDFVCVFFSLFCFRQFSVLQLLVILN